HAAVRAGEIALVGAGEAEVVGPKRARAPALRPPRAPAATPRHSIHPSKKGLTHRRKSFECRREDSNLHSLNGNQVLNLARLPVPPLRLAQVILRGCSRGRQVKGRKGPRRTAFRRVTSAPCRSPPHSCGAGLTV